jgi:hypothetical protein
MRQKRQVEKRELVARNVRPDSRHRISLRTALSGIADDVSFDVFRDREGRIILEPKVSIPAAEAWLYRNKEALAAVRRGLADAAAGNVTTAMSYAQYVDDDDEA